MSYIFKDKEIEKTDAPANEDDGGDGIWEDVVKESSVDLLQPANEDEDEDSTTTTERWACQSMCIIYEPISIRNNSIIFFIGRYDRFKNSGQNIDSDTDKIDESIEELKKDDIIDDAKE